MQNDDYCMQHATDYFGGNSTEGWNAETYTQDSSVCVNGDSWQCTRQNFGSTDGGE